MSYSIMLLFICSLQQQSPAVYELLHISPTPKGWYSLCQAEPGPLETEASVLQLGHLLPKTIWKQSANKLIQT